VDLAPERSLVQELGSFGRRNPMAVVGGLVGFLVILMAIGALIAPSDPENDGRQAGIRAPRPIDQSDRAAPQVSVVSREAYGFSEMTTASPPRLRISPSRFAFSRRITPASFCIQRSPALDVPMAKP
jgi:hypothetical protein